MTRYEQQTVNCLCKICKHRDLNTISCVCNSSMGYEQKIQVGKVSKPCPHSFMNCIRIIKCNSYERRN